MLHLFRNVFQRESCNNLLLKIKCLEITMSDVGFYHVTEQTDGSADRMDNAID